MSESPRGMLILGSGGLVGTEVARVAHERSIAYRALRHAECDIASAKQVGAAISKSGYGTVINCAAYNAVDQAEVEGEAALRSNRDGAANVARLARTVVHYSTDFVFSGTSQTPYHERDLPQPQSAYARSKFAGDGEIQRLNPRHFLMRVGCLYGAAGKGFGSTLLLRLQAGERIRADCDRQLQPTWARCVAVQTFTLLQTEHFGLYHVMCHGQTTWADFGREFARLAGFDPMLIDSASTASLAAVAPRPAYAVLENRALADLRLDRMPTWQEALTGYLAEALSGNGGLK